MPADSAKIQVVEAVFAAGQGQDQAVHRRLFDEFRVIIPARMGAVAAADQIDAADGAAADRRNDRVCLLQHCVMGKAGHQHMAAVDAAHGVIVGVAAQRLGLVG